MRIKLYLFSVALLLLSSGSGYACTCVSESLLPGARPIEEQVESARRESEAIFSGVVTRVVFHRASKTYEAKFRVYTSWKGAVSREVSIFRPADFPCMYTFERGGKYLVYAYSVEVNGEKRLFAGACGRTQFLRSAGEDMRLLGKGKAVGRVRAATSEPAKPNNGMHPAPYHAASHETYVGARVMPGARWLLVLSLLIL